MNDLTERVAAAILAAEDGGSTRRKDPFENITPIGQKRYRAKARAAIREVLAALRGWEHTNGDDIDFLDAFASAHGIEPTEGGTGP
jgi:hypothetical protein